MDKRNSLKRITTFVTNQHSFEICQDEKGGFWGFDSSELDNGKLAKEYNGITGNHSSSMIGTMRMCYQKARTDNEIDREKLNKNDPEELKKLLSIVSDSFKEIT